MARARHLRVPLQVRRERVRLLHTPQTEQHVRLERALALDERRAVAHARRIDLRRIELRLERFFVSSVGGAASRVA